MKCPQDRVVAGGELAALGDLPVGGGEGDEVEAFEFIADVAPGVADVVSATRSNSKASHCSCTWARMRSSRWW